MDVQLVEAPWPIPLLPSTLDELVKVVSSNEFLSELDTLFNVMVMVMMI